MLHVHYPVFVTFIILIVGDSNTTDLSAMIMDMSDDMNDSIVVRKYVCMYICVADNFKQVAM